MQKVTSRRVVIEFVTDLDLAAVVDGVSRLRKASATKKRQQGVRKKRARSHGTQSENLRYHDFCIFSWKIGDNCSNGATRIIRASF